MRNNQDLLIMLPPLYLQVRGETRRGIKRLAEFGPGQIVGVMGRMTMAVIEIQKGNIQKWGVEEGEIKSSLCDMLNFQNLESTQVEISNRQVRCIGTEM